MTGNAHASSIRAVAVVAFAWVGAAVSPPTPAQCVEWSSGEFGAPFPDGEVRAQAIFDDGSGPALFVAGAFSTVGRVSARSIARFDGRDWSPLGVGLNQYRIESAAYVREVGDLKFADIIAESPRIVHNTYLQLLAETGIVGLLADVLAMKEASLPHGSVPDAAPQAERMSGKGGVRERATDFIDRIRGFKDAVMNQRVICVARDEKHFQSRTARQEFLCQLNAAHSRHYHVRQKHVDRSLVIFQSHNGFGSFSRFQHVVTTTA